MQAVRLLAFSQFRLQTSIKASLLPRLSTLTSHAQIARNLWQLFFTPSCTCICKIIETTRDQDILIAEYTKFSFPYSISPEQNVLLASDLRRKSLEFCTKRKKTAIHASLRSKSANHLHSKSPPATPTRITSSSTSSFAACLPFYSTASKRIHTFWIISARIYHRITTASRHYRWPSWGTCRIDLTRCHHHYSSLLSQ